MEKAEKLREYARNYYYRVLDNPEKKTMREETRRKWYEKNKQLVLQKQRDKKRERKLEAINYLGGKCKGCEKQFHPAVYEFHHRNPLEKDYDPSKVFNRSREKMYKELDKCDLLCANCHRVVHHSWEYEFDSVQTSKL